MLSSNHASLAVNSGAKLSSLNASKYKMLLVVTEVYRQQLWMYENKSKRVDDRIGAYNATAYPPYSKRKSGKTCGI